MTTADLFKAKARALARSGHFYGLPPLEFELRFEEGFHEARAWLATQLGKNSKTFARVQADRKAA
jgi:hypothetical protein